MYHVFYAQIFYKYFSNAIHSCITYVAYNYPFDMICLTIASYIDIDFLYYDSHSPNLCMHTNFIIKIQRHFKAANLTFLYG